MERREIKTRLTIYRRRKQAQEAELLKKDYHNLFHLALQKPDTAPDNAKEALRSFALPDDYKKIISHLGTCRKKTRRLADLSLDLWDRLDSGIYMSTMRKVFFDTEGNLRSEPLDILFSKLYSSLLNEFRRAKMQSRHAAFEEMRQKIREHRPQALTHRDVRQGAMYCRSAIREIEKTALKRDYQCLRLILKIDEEVMPSDLKELLEMFSLPPDYDKIISHLGTCPAKTRRIADRSLGLWNRMDSRIYFGILKSTFFNEDGILRSSDIDSLFKQFHDTLIEALQMIKKIDQ